MVKPLRLNFLFLLFFLFAAALVWRLVFLQLVQGNLYRALAQGQQAMKEEDEPQRGTIFLEESDGKLVPLATQRVIKYIFASPPEIQDKERATEELSTILGKRKESILEKLSKEESLYEILSLRPTEEQVSKILANSQKGIYIQDRTTRVYPRESFAAHLVGFVGADGNGQYGIEGYYDERLKGKENFTRGILAAAFDLNTILGRQKGADLVLTIDPNIQFFAEKLLTEAAKNLSFREGTIIVMDPGTGRIIALANFPSFDPNNYFEERNFEVFQNPALQKIFEPGSAFKPFTIAAALQEQKVTPETTYFDEGIVRIGGYAIYNYDKRSYGQATIREVLEKSINTGAVFAERQLGDQNFLSYIKKFGFMEPTGVDLQGEIFSENKTLLRGREINFATASFGQGIELTPLQLIRAFSSLVNGGKLVRPFVVSRIINQNGSVEEIKPEIGPQVISQETSNTISSLLVSVVENGFGKRARIPGYYIGGKTGTAQVPWTALGIQKAGYSDETIQSFLGFAPAFNPRFIILVKLNNPKTKTAEYSAVPIFHDLAKYIIDYWAIPPDYDVPR
jgi:stage V sporulation protein D (sporulation-specific penicillin-binding protein)